MLGWALPSMAAEPVPASALDLRMNTPKGAVAVSTGGKAEVEVSVSSYPLAMTLRVYKTKIKPEEFLGCQIILKNVGKEELRISDWLFTEPSQAHLTEQGDLKHGIYFELMRAGRVLKQSTCDFSDLMPDRDRGEALLRRDIAQAAASPIVHRLTPGGQLTARPTAEMIEQRSMQTKNHSSNPADFFDLSSYCLTVAHKYKLRLVYDYSWLGNSLSKRKRSASGTAGAVLMKTPWIDVEVVP
ncbi:MAG: hypothetical protein WC969_11720 [Elusimicrobiota bacterium]|jgi:hypothetical protein